MATMRGRVILYDSGGKPHEVDGVQSIKVVAESGDLITPSDEEIELVKQYLIDNPGTLAVSIFIDKWHVINVTGLANN